MQNGMMTTPLTPNNRLYFVPTSKILIEPSKSGETRRRLADSLAARFADSGGRGGCYGLQHSAQVPVRLGCLPGPNGDLVLVPLADIVPKRDFQGASGAY